MPVSNHRGVWLWTLAVLQPKRGYICMFRFCLVRERPVKSIRKKLNLNNLDKAVGLSLGGFFVLILFIYLNQCLVYSPETVKEVTSHGLLESICIAWLRLHWESKFSSSFSAFSFLLLCGNKRQKRKLVMFWSVFGKKEQFSNIVIIDCNTFMNRM